MNSMRNFLCVLMALVLAAFALPSMGAGPQKTYSILLQANATYSTTTPPVLNTPVAVSVFVKNESPPSQANSNIGSFTFTLAGVTILDQPTCPLALCSADTTTNTVTVTNISPPIQGQQWLEVSFHVNSCGDSNVTSAVFTGSQLNGATFKSTPDPDFFNVGLGNGPTPSTSAASISCGNLACGNGFSVPDSTGVVITGFRSNPDKDGVACTTVPYFVTDTLAANNLVHFRWPVLDTEQTPDPAAVFSYTINAASGNPLVAWLPVIGSPIFIPAPTCLTATLPAPYAALAADVALNDKKIQVTTSANALAVPFPIVIGTERMQVTKIVSSNNTWTVTRHTGGTSATTHTTGDPVMSTPLPLLASGVPSPYTVGNQAQMCIPPGGITGNSTTIYDIGDGWSSP